MRVNSEFFADFRLSLYLVWVVLFSFAEIIGSIFHRQNAIPNKDWIDDGVQQLCPDLNEIENHHTDLIPCLSFFAFSSLLSRFLLVFDLMCSIFLATISIWWMQQNGKFVVFFSLSFSRSPPYSFHSLALALAIQLVRLDGCAF